MAARRAEARRRLPREMLARGGGVHLRRISMADLELLLRIARTSRSLHRPWVAPPTRRESLATWIREGRGPNPGGRGTRGEGSNRRGSNRRGSNRGRGSNRRGSNRVRLLLCRDLDGEILGYFALGEIARGNLSSAYLGYWVNAAHAGQRRMAAGMPLLLRYAFVGLRLHRVEANIQPGNEASIALVRSAGFRREGFSPRYLKVAGRWRDHERWALTVEDWRELRSRRSSALPGGG